jgi:hypothetical protein
LKFSIKKRNLSDIKNRHKSSQDGSLENKPPLPKDNEENKGKVRKKTDNNTVGIKKAEFIGTGSGREKQGELQTTKDPKEEEEAEGIICHHCKEKIDHQWKEPHWKWNLDKDIKYCIKCYGNKEIEYEKLMNYCGVCSSKLKFIRYNPKPQWKLRGQLCRMCWDSQNLKFKADKKRVGIS